MLIPGVGKSIAHDLWNIGIRNISDLSGQDPEFLYLVQMLWLPIEIEHNQ